MTIQTILFYVGFVLVGAFFLHIVWFTERMKKVAPGIYKDLGEPEFGFFSIKRYRAGKKLMNYLRRGEHLHLEDKKLLKLGTRIRVLRLLVFLEFATLFLLNILLSE
ncbi:MAG: hypothetical protein ED557_09880 [Balneola sp.]|nr:MAG: hypothetical protein ED557_09880 [Balneola sp.]